MLTAPAAVTNKALKNVGMSKDDIDLFEPERGLRQRGAALHAPRSTSTTTR